MARAVFLDRDGTLIEDVEYLADPRLVRLVPRAASALLRLEAAGFERIVVSNQSAVARGLATPDDVSAVQRKISELLAEGGASIDAWYYCFHHPEGALPEWRAVCDCRKPAPGLILTAAMQRGLDLSSCFLIGNMWSDVEAARRAGIRGVLLETPAGPGGGDKAKPAENLSGDIAGSGRSPIAAGGVPQRREEFRGLHPPWATARGLEEAVDLILSAAGGPRPPREGEGTG